MNTLKTILEWNSFLQEGPLGRAIDKTIDKKVNIPVANQIVKQSVRDASAKALRDIRNGTLKGRFSKKEEKDSPVKTWLKKTGIKAVNKMPGSLRRKTAKKVRDEIVKFLEKE